jgi:hypothetical protein
MQYFIGLSNESMLLFVLEITLWDGKEVFSAVTGRRAQFFSRLGYGGNRSSELVEENAEGARFIRLWWTPP